MPLDISVPSAAPAGYGEFDTTFATAVVADDTAPVTAEVADEIAPVTDSNQLPFSVFGV
jgi:hypothetical protein